MKVSPHGCISTRVVKSNFLTGDIFLFFVWTCFAQSEERMDNVLVGLPSRNHSDPIVVGMDKVKEHNVPPVLFRHSPPLV